jgi:glucokinase
MGSSAEATAPRCALGIDLGGTEIKAVVVDEDGTIIRREARPTGDTGESSCAWALTIRDLALELGKAMPVGIAAPGLAAADARSIAFMPGRLRGLEQLDWTKHLGRTELVPVTNDAHASILAEAWIGAARGVRNVAMLTLGTGVGGALMVDGRLLRGHLGRAGHLGHLCLDLDGAPDIVGTPGSLEDFIGNHNVQARSGGRFATTRELLAAAAADDPEAARIWVRSVHALACAIASLINVVDPALVIIGGGIASAGDQLFTPLEAALAKMEWRPAGHTVRIVPAALDEWSGAIGAARTALAPALRI